MRKEELIQLIESLPTEDTKGNIEGIFYDRYGSKISTDSIRLDMDGGRIIMVQKGSDYYEKNNSNWQKEMEFMNNGRKRKQT